MKRMIFAASLATLLAASSADAQVIYTEDFDDGAAATRWSAPVVSTFGAAFDGDVIYDFDYSTVGIPAAPGSSGSTTGILFESNVSVNPGSGGFEGETIGIVPTVGGTLPNGNYRYSVDAYFVVERENSGSTEFALLGVHAADFNAPGSTTTPASLDVGNDDLPFDFGVSNGNGLSYHASGDSGAFNDFHRYADADNADAGTQTGLGNYDSRRFPDGLSGPEDLSAFPSLADPVNGAERVWLELAIEKTGDFYKFFVDGTLIDTFNGGGAFTDGTILLGYADMFSSVGVRGLDVGPDPTPFDDSDGPFGDSIPGFAHFVVFDNVTITVPEPTSAVLGLVALGGLTVRRRR